MGSYTVILIIAQFHSNLQYDAVHKVKLWQHLITESIRFFILSSFFFTLLYKLSKLKRKSRKTKSYLNFFEIKIVKILSFQNGWN